MNKVWILISLIYSISLSTAYAEVWHSNQKWDEYWEKEYEKWVRNTLRTDVFSGNHGLLNGISTDCADALYAIRIQFAYENQLPFVINAPDVLKDKITLFGNGTNMFDHITDQRKRVRAFINYVSEEVGTTELMRDTFPVKIKEINSGIVYVVEWKLFGKPNRHSYIIKGFNPDKELLFYASDAPRKVRKLQIDTQYPRFSYDRAPFGFRKWKRPEHFLMAEKDIPAADGYSDEQYVLLRKVGKKNILKRINDILQSN